MPEVFSGLVVPNWWKSGVGLLLPSTVRDLHVDPNQPGARQRFNALLKAERRRPLGNVGVYATPSELGLAPLPFEEFEATLASIPLGMILPVASEVQAMLYDHEMDPRAQYGLAAGLFGGTPAYRALRRFLNGAPGGERVAFCEQALTVLQLLAIVSCEEELTDLTQDEYMARIRGAIVYVSGYLQPANATVAGDRDAWLGHLTQLFEYNGHPHFGNAMGRTWAIFRRLHHEAVDVCPAVPLDDWLLEDYGLDLEQQMSLGFALFAHLGTNGADEEGFTSNLKRQTLAGIFNNLDFTEEECVAAERLIAAPPGWFRHQVAGQSVEQLSWNRVPFMRRPFVRMQSGDYLLQSPRALMSWIADGVYYRCLDSARDRGKVLDYTTRIGKLTELYVLELVKSAHKGTRLPGAGKVFGDKKFGNGIDSSDVTITYPSEVVLMEVASHRLTVESKCDGDREALEHDLTEMIGKRPKQLRRSIDAMKPNAPGRAANLRFDGLESKRIARFWPVIVTMTPVHWSPLLEEFLAPWLAELDGRNDVETLDVLPVEDIEVLIGITEQTGHRLADVLAAKLEASGAHADLRTWLSTDRRFPNISRPTYLDKALDDAMDVAARLLGFEDTAAA
jgi:hypothetical protein